MKNISHFDTQAYGNITGNYRTNATARQHGGNAMDSQGLVKQIMELLKGKTADEVLSILSTVKTNTLKSATV